MRKTYKQNLKREKINMMRPVTQKLRSTPTPTRAFLTRSAVVSDSHHSPIRDQAFDRYRDGQYSDAIELFHSIPDKLLDDYVGIARCYLKMGNLPTAAQLLKSLEPASNNSRQQLLILTSLAHVQLTQGKFKEAEANLYKIACQDDPQVIYAWIRLHEANKEIDLALKKCEQNEKAFPSHYHTFFAHAIILRDQGTSKGYAHALQVLKPFAKEYHILKPVLKRLRPRSFAMSQVLLSMIYRDLGDIDKAFEFAKKAIAADDSYALAYTSLGKCFQFRNALGDFERARECFNKSLKRDKKRFEKLHSQSSHEHLSVKLNAAQDDENDLIENHIRKALKIDESAANVHSKVSRDGWDDPEEVKRNEVKVIRDERKAERDKVKKRVPKKRWDEDLTDGVSIAPLETSKRFVALESNEDESKEEPIDELIQRTLKAVEPNAPESITDPISALLVALENKKSATPIYGVFHERIRDAFDIHLASSLTPHYLKTATEFPPIQEDPVDKKPRLD